MKIWPSILKNLFPLAIASLLLLTVWAEPAAETVLDFSAPIVTPKLRKASGERPVLVILWNPLRMNQPSLSPEYIEKLIFGPGPNVRDWFSENFGGLFKLKKAGVLGWYYPSPTNSTITTSASESLSNTPTPWADALRQAGREFDFASYDSNHDGRLSPDELGVFIVTPQKVSSGTNQIWHGRSYSGGDRLRVNGLRLSAIAEWRTGTLPNLGCAAHELSHLLLNLPDMYNEPSWPYAPGVFCLMDSCFTTTHLNPFFKLKLGWLKFQVVSRSGEYWLRDVETHNEALILYDPSHGSQEYFILENRWTGSSYDSGRWELGTGLPTSGLAVWRVAEAPRLFNRMNPPLGGRGEWGRRGIHLLRANGGQPATDALALFDKTSMTLSSTTQPARLVWSDQSPAPFKIEVLGLSRGQIQLKIDLSP